MIQKTLEIKELREGRRERALGSGIVCPHGGSEKEQKENQPGSELLWSPALHLPSAMPREAEGAGTLSSTQHFVHNSSGTKKVLKWNSEQNYLEDDGLHPSW